MIYLNDGEIKNIRAEIALLKEDLQIFTGFIKTEIFELLEKKGTLIFMPEREKEFWGIYARKMGRDFFIINSSIELEKQVFAAAHELAHSLDIAKVGHEIVTAELMTEYVEHSEFGESLKKADVIANRFAAELLVDRNLLKQVLDELPRIYDLKTKAVVLSDKFLVPYKTIVKRLEETSLIDDVEMKSLLEVTSEELKNIADRHECCRQNYKITETETYGLYINKALLEYEHELSTYDKLSNRLEVLGKKPIEYGIEDTEFDMYDFLLRASELEEEGDEDEE